MIRKLLLTAVLMVFVCGVANAGKLRLEDLGRGTAPGLVVADMIALGGVSPAFGFVYNGESYVPKVDMTVEREGLLGRMSSDFDWNPCFGVGFTYAFGEWVGFEALYNWGFTKVGDEVEYEETSEGTLMLNVWLEF